MISLASQIKIMRLWKLIDRCTIIIYKCQTYSTNISFYVTMSRGSGKTAMMHDAIRRIIKNQNRIFKYTKLKVNLRNEILVCCKMEYTC